MRGLLKWKGGLVVVGALSVAVAAGADEPAKQQMPVSVPAASAGECPNSGMDMQPSASPTILRCGSTRRAAPGTRRAG